jgi:hypothetical protein
MHGKPRIQGEALLEPPVDADAELALEQAVGTTASGGVLFLLWLVAELELPDRFADDPAFGAHPVHWWLYQLALAAAGVAPDDPAALAFAGQPPGSVPASLWDPAAPADLAQIAELVDRSGLALAARLDRDAAEAPALLTWICDRPARIVADPGWIEAEFDLARVDTGLRRVGLDLDPGYLPWLGVVLRFRYA